MVTRAISGLKILIKSICSKHKKESGLDSYTHITKLSDMNGALVTHAQGVGNTYSTHSAIAPHVQYTMMLFP